MSVCILTLVIRHANGMLSAPYYVVICDLSGSTTTFFALSEIRHDISDKKCPEHKMCVLIFSTTFV
jgi:hypothetical protein